MKKKNIGTSFDNWLREEGVHEEVIAGAIKRVLARQAVEAAMEQEGLSNTAMAQRMQTSRSALDRLLDPDNESVTLATLQKAAAAIGRKVRLELVWMKRMKRDSHRIKNKEVSRAIGEFQESRDGKVGGSSDRHLNHSATPR